MMYTVLWCMNEVENIVVITMVMDLYIFNIMIIAVSFITVLGGSIIGIDILSYSNDALK